MNYGGIMKECQDSKSCKFIIFKDTILTSIL